MHTLTLLAVLALLLQGQVAAAASHREAPLISMDPLAVIDDGGPKAGGKSLQASPKRPRADLQSGGFVPRSGYSSAHRSQQPIRIITRPDSTGATTSGPNASDRLTSDTSPKRPDLMSHIGGVRIANQFIAWDQTLQVGPNDAIAEKGGLCLFTVQWYVKNQGSADAGSFQVKLRDGDQVLQASNVFSVPVGVTGSVVEEVWIAPGQHSLAVDLDANNDVVESNEFNNSNDVNLKVSGNCQASASRKDAVSRLRKASAKPQAGGNADTRAATKRSLGRNDVKPGSGKSLRDTTSVGARDESIAPRGFALGSHKPSGREHNRDDRGKRIDGPRTRDE